MEKRKNNAWIAVTMVLTGIAPVLLMAERIADPNGNANLISRNIETAPKLWLNGYLGTITDLSLTGFFGILMAILALLFYKAGQRLKGKAILLAIIYLITSLIVAALGYYNDRYQLTLVPFTLLIVAYLLNRLFVASDRFRLLMVLGVLTLLNTAFFFRFDLWERYASRLSDFQPAKKEEPAQTKTEESPVLDSMTTNTTKSVKDIYLYIEEELPEGDFLVNNVPAFYVYTSRKGHYYWAGYDDLYSKDGPVALMEDRSEPELSRYLTEDLNCTYLLHAEKLMKFSPTFDQFLVNQCKLIAADSKGYQVYQIVAE
ncbi:hypothetical protein KFE98_00365 [bacterium SCSIO 12741]|nr:hypothetical protein KFE98_00365 [bacterium SCSIO 12741]